MGRFIGTSASNVRFLGRTWRRRNPLSHIGFSLGHKGGNWTKRDVEWLEQVSKHNTKEEEDSDLDLVES